MRLRMRKVTMRTTFLAGLIASVAMTMMEMVYEGIFGAGFWSAPTFIAATILRDLQSVAIPVTFSLVPVVLGMMGHMMNSVVLGFVFVKISEKFLQTRISGIVAGAVYGIALFVAMWFLVLPVIDPVMLNLNTMVFAISHIVWGAVLGAFVARRT